MPFERRLVDPYSTSVRLERDERRIANRLNIKLSDALHLGLKILIDLKFERMKNPGITKDLLESWKEIRDKDSEDLKACILMHKEGQALIQKYQSALPVEEKKIRCYDKAQEAYAMIPASEYQAHPDWYVVDEETAEHEAPYKAPYEVRT